MAKRSVLEKEGKVYCINCDYYGPGEKCYSSHNTTNRDTWLKVELAHLKTPREINNDNSCSWYDDCWEEETTMAKKYKIKEQKKWQQ